MKYNNYQCDLADEQAMQQFGQKLIQAIIKMPVTPNGIILHLNGDLGAGKTTLSRAMIQALGYQGNVKSPTYTLVEEYAIGEKRIYHFDLYRLADPEELEFMGIRDYFSPQSICLLEWAEKGKGFLPEQSLTINIDFAPQGRHIYLQANTLLGEQIICQFVEDQAK
ncbi:tRNA (adenosine(37)-N6)-threonylcarbamoyltransferase complex ATPase subunit type 1 TsaE [Volucribacter amazonae]|uniref:tRNA threonylcarbamoyladenosine biosynthesis protein TsaE n=1 Tax=Volucribacter amazonae TaxID=256731 RepID=A0A9X4PR19_9PAST|nr:tRNA (adenosine(37)-N6)-threonylcarbamoyltransferase complex ATPase subunit type 1 TsaE [Volucribacter amazonae]MDG6896048.1 tRNA threonylcarbamoyladenosine biosynthesis protein TsaE [Volucribacter amazonae]